MDDNKKIITDFLTARRQMVLATSDEKHPWICTVYYVLDDDFNFYFFSFSDTIHIQQINKNNKVAVNVADSPQDPKGNRIGLQLWGEVERLKDVEKIQWFINNWTDTPDKFNAQEIASSEEKGVYKISPKQIKYFNKEVTGSNHGYNFSLEFN